MEKGEEQQFDLREFVFGNKTSVFVFLVGVVLLGTGLIVSKQFVSSDKVEVLEDATVAQDAVSEIVVEVSGEVINPGVYKLSKGARINDALIIAGGFSENADRSWVEKNLNRAAKVGDGTKIYIPKVGQQSGVPSASNIEGVQTVSSDRGSGLLNINTASQSQLEGLPGIGPVYAQSIIEHRPYSTVEELLSKDALKKSTYEKVKDLVSPF